MQSPCILHQNNGTMLPEKTLCLALWCWLCPTHYTAVRVNNCLKRTSAIKVATMKIITQNQHFSWWAKMNGIQRRALVSPWRVHFMNSSASKGTSWAEAMPSSKKIKPVSLAIVELCWSEHIRLAGKQLVS